MLSYLLCLGGIMSDFQDFCIARLKDIDDNGTTKLEHVLTSPQDTKINIGGKTHVLNFASNNYLGLANHPVVVSNIAEIVGTHGFGTASERPVCGTQNLHKNFERYLAKFLQADDAMLCNSCFSANMGLFDALFDEKDAIIGDSQNHVSILDGIRLSRANNVPYRHVDLQELEAQLKATQNYRYRMIVTEGVFRVDGELAPLDKIVELAQKYDALLMVNDSHGSGVLGANGRGTGEHFHIMDKIDITTSTLSNALGGGGGGFIVSHQPIIDILRQRMSSYAYSNAVAPALMAGAMKALEIVHGSEKMRQRLKENRQFFVDGMTDMGYAVKSGLHPIVPVVFQERTMTRQFVENLFEQGIYVVAVSYPDTAIDQAFIRVQFTSAHKKVDVVVLLNAFGRAGKKLGFIE